MLITISKTPDPDTGKKSSKTPAPMVNRKVLKPSVSVPKLPKTSAKKASGLAKGKDVLSTPARKNKSQKKALPFSSPELTKEHLDDSDSASEEEDLVERACRFLLAKGISDLSLRGNADDRSEPEVLRSTGSVVEVDLDSDSIDTTVAYDGEIMVEPGTENPDTELFVYPGPDIADGTEETVVADHSSELEDCHENITVVNGDLVVVTNEFQPNAESTLLTDGSDVFLDALDESFEETDLQSQVPEMSEYADTNESNVTQQESSSLDTLEYDVSSNAAWNPVAESVTHSAAEDESRDTFQQNRRERREIKQPKRLTYKKLGKPSTSRSAF